MIRVMTGSRPGALGCKNFPGETPIVKYRADRSMIANFLRDLKKAERRRHSSPGIADPELRGRNRINRHLRAALHQHQFLILHANDNPIGEPIGATSVPGERENRDTNRAKKGVLCETWGVFIKICVLSRRNCRAPRERRRRKTRPPLCE